MNFILYPTSSNRFMQLLHVILSTLLILTSCKNEEERIELISQEATYEPTIVTCIDIDIICIQKLQSSYLIRNDKEYKELLNYRSSHPDCPNYELPYINFNTHTLLGYHTVVGGCSAPKVQKILIKNSTNYIFRVSIEQEGACKIAQSVSVWCLVPKINNNESISYEQILL